MVDGAGGFESIYGKGFVTTEWSRATFCAGEAMVYK